MNEIDARRRIVHWGASLHRRGLTSGASGNISVRLDSGYIVTPTNSCLGDLKEHELSRLDGEWRLLAGAKPTKEIPLHRAFYETRPQAGAVVHLHSTFATLLSCLEDTDPRDVLPAITPYVLMRVGQAPLLAFTPPGSQETGDLISALAGAHAAVLLANHGPVVSASTLDDAVYAAEEFEEAAKLVVLSRGLSVRLLDAAQRRAVVPASGA